MRLRLHMRYAVESVRRFTIQDQLALAENRRLVQVTARALTWDRPKLTPPRAWAPDQLGGSAHKYVQTRRSLIPPASMIRSHLAVRVQITYSV